MITQLDKRRFWSKVDIGNITEDWPWLAAKTKDSYGVGYVPDLGATSAHRIAYILTYGYIPYGLYILHKCDSPSCCNPLHLYAGTQGQNMADREARYIGSSVMGRPKKIKQDEFDNIKSLYNLGNNQKVIASIYNTDQGTISRIVNNTIRRR